MSHTVLIVDDSEFMRVMLREIIEDMGWSVSAEAADGHEAISAWQQARPDLIVMDINMPNLDGTGALAQIIAKEPEARIVMIAALGQKDEVLAAIKAGARDFIIKPFDHERVQETLSRLVEADAPA